MESKITKKERYWIIAYSGDTGDLMPGPLPEVLDALNHGALAILLDLENLKYINPNGIKALKDSLEIVRGRQANMGITHPQPQVRRALKLGGLVPGVPVYYDVQEALANLDLVNYQDLANVDLTDRLLICQKKLPIAGKLREAFRKHPQKPHFRMIPCRDMTQAFDTLFEERVDLIIIESGYPLYHVTNFIEKAETDKRLPSIPILVVAPDEKLAEAELMIRNGAHEILRYPFSPIEAVIRIQTLISHLKDHRPFIPPKKVVQPRGFKA